MGSHELFFNRNILRNILDKIHYIYIYIYILRIHPQTLELFLFVDNSIWYWQV